MIARLAFREAISGSLIGGPGMERKYVDHAETPGSAGPSWDWPGNIRELENLIERAVILTRGRSLEAPLAGLQKTKTDTTPRADLHEAGRVARERTKSRRDKTSTADEYVRKQRDAIVHALTESKGRVGGPYGAAARLGTNRTTLLARMKKFGIDRREYA